MIELKNVSKHFQVGDAKVQAVDDVSFTVAKGQIAAIVGPSGCGKTTLLNLIGQLIRPTSGTIEIGGQHADLRRQRDAARFRNENFGYVVQDFALVESDTVFDNVRIPLVYSRTRRKGQRRAVENALSAFGVADYIDYPVSKLSGGQRQRVALARAVVNEPSIILADEPTGALDEVNSKQVFAYLQVCARQGRSVVIVTHDAELAARSDVVYRIRGGHLIASESRHDLLPNY